MFDVVRGAPWPAIYPGRALRNAFSARWHGREEALAADRQAQEDAYLATAPDDFATRVVWAGEGVDLVNDILPASEIIERIVAQAAAILTQGAQHGPRDRIAFGLNMHRRSASTPILTTLQNALSLRGPKRRGNLHRSASTRWGLLRSARNDRQT